MKVAVFLAAGAANGDWTPPVAIGRPNPLPPGNNLNIAIFAFQDFNFLQREDHLVVLHLQI